MVLTKMQVRNILDKNVLKKVLLKNWGTWNYIIMTE